MGRAEWGWLREPAIGEGWRKLRGEIFLHLEVGFVGLL